MEIKLTKHSTKYMYLLCFETFFFFFEFVDLIYFGNLRLNFDEDEIPKCVNYKFFTRINYNHLCLNFLINSNKIEHDVQLRFHFLDTLFNQNSC